MARPNVFAVDTVLFHPSEGKRLFPAGETDPGAAWSDKQGGEPVGKGATAQALKDLITAQDQIDGLGDQMARKDHDLAVMAAQRDEAVGKVADLEQRAIAAEAGRVSAEDAARDYMVERDQARGEVQGARAEADKARADLAAAEELIADQQATLASQSEEIDVLRAEIAKVDGDGDGKVGGRKPKAPAEPAEAL